jgi:hypothetical protein
MIDHTLCKNIKQVMLKIDKFIFQNFVGEMFLMNNKKKVSPFFLKSLGRDSGPPQGAAVLELGHDKEKRKLADHKADVIASRIDSH